MNLDIPIVYIINGTLLLLVAMITSVKRGNGDRLANFYLSGYLWCFGLSTVLALLVLFGYAAKMIHLYRTSFVPGMLIMPFSIMYLSRILYGTRPRLIHLLHLVPLLFYLTDYLPFYFLNADEKMQIFLTESADPVRFKLAYAEGWFMPAYSHVIIRHTLYFGYWIAQVVMLTKALRNPDHPLLYQAPKTWRWLQVYVFSQLFIFIPPLLAVIFGSSKTVSSLINVAAFAASLIQVYYLLFHPEVLYSLENALIKPTEAVLSELPQQDLPAAQEEPMAGSESLAKPAPFLTDDAMTLIEEKINTLMTIDKPFTQVRYSIGDLSRDVGVPTYKLSYFINNRYGLNFYGFLNRYRIQYCLQKFQAEEHHLKTLDALALECGFQSRATFVRAFKGVTGKTPSDYLADHA